MVAKRRVTLCVSAEPRDDTAGEVHLEKPFLFGDKEPSILVQYTMAITFKFQLIKRKCLLC